MYIKVLTYNKIISVKKLKNNILRLQHIENKKIFAKIIKQKKRFANWGCSGFDR